ncbi:hypothetical protein KC669_01790 [Candidatus Dojkabacteria bacterium]|uniref:Uncharacterized protein n=1 Tax=Candidatus Dojkabacteria bacterium TaxID=2099670 RepID=A0A955LAV9_9BACT|nr:hypothetical protein [Candidatus Dojkabacteria bacterium]
MEGTEATEPDDSQDQDNSIWISQSVEWYRYFSKHVLENGYDNSPQTLRYMAIQSVSFMLQDTKIFDDETRGRNLILKLMNNEGIASYRDLNDAKIFLHKVEFLILNSTQNKLTKEILLDIRELAKRYVLRQTIM